MTTTISPVIGTSISSLISSTYGPILNLKESEIMDYCQKLGEVYAGYVDEELVCLWGLIPPSFLSMEAYLWMWCSEAMIGHQFIFVRHSQRQIEKMLLRYEQIKGHCTVGSKARRWLSWLGAEFEPYPEDGKLGFVIRRPYNG